MNNSGIGGMINTRAVGGLVSNRPPTRGEQNAVKLPQMNDNAAIEAQREELRQQEAQRGRQQQGN
jgi:hypothetical protein